MTLEIREGKPWVTENEQSDLIEKIKDTLDFVEEKANLQETQGSLNEDPLFTMDEVEAKMKKLTTFSDKIFNKKKPKEPKKPKETKAKEQDKEEQKSEDTEEKKDEDEKTESTESSEEQRQETKDEEKKSEEQVNEDL